MKKLATIILAVVVTLSIASCAGTRANIRSEKIIKIDQPTSTEKINFVYQNEIVGSMTLAQFQAMVLAAEQYGKIRVAELTGTMKIVLHDDPWKLPTTTDGIFTTKAIVYWLNKKGKAVKKLEIKITLTNKKGKVEALSISEIYGKIAKIALPISLGGNIALVIILLIILL